MSESGPKTPGSERANTPFASSAVAAAPLTESKMDWPGTLGEVPESWHAMTDSATPMKSQAILNFDMVLQGRQVKREQSAQDDYFASTRVIFAPSARNRSSIRS